MTSSVVRTDMTVSPRLSIWPLNSARAKERDHNETKRKKRLLKKAEGESRERGGRLDVWLWSSYGSDCAEIDLNDRSSCPAVSNFSEPNIPGIGRDKLSLCRAFILGCYLGSTRIIIRQMTDSITTL